MQSWSITNKPKAGLHHNLHYCRVLSYESQVDNEERDPAQVVQATYELGPEDIAAVEKVFGSECLQDKAISLTLKKGYPNELTFNGLSVDSEAALKHLVSTADLPTSLEDQLLSETTPEEMVKILQSSEEPTESSQNLMSSLQDISGQEFSYVVFHQILHPRTPKFMYFDEYYQMKGQDNIDALRGRVENNTLEEADYPLLGLIDLAGLSLNQLINPRQTSVLRARLEAAANELTDKVLKYWSQNKHLLMEFDLRPALPEDPPGMTAGTNIWGLVNDTKHRASTELGTRSRGFIWFFSFLAWYSRLRKERENIILLLDEPGLSLHAKAQEDLLRYFEEQLKPHHQLIYTTHSPFMVDPTHFDRVRIVQDLSLESDSDDLPEEQQGTKVITEIIDATSDSLFPIQGALGYEIHQTLFIGPNNFVVEGASDLLYIQTISAILQENGKEGLSSDWTITPVGGSDKVPTFVALIGAQTNLNLAVLIDYQKKDQQKIEDLYKRKLLKKNNVRTYADYAQGSEADIEDMFEPEFYLKLVKGAFGVSISSTDLASKHPRIIHRLEEYLESNPLPNNQPFNHFRPARYLSENIGCLENELSKQELGRFEQVFKDLNALL